MNTAAASWVLPTLLGGGGVRNALIKRSCQLAPHHASILSPGAQRNGQAGGIARQQRHTAQAVLFQDQVCALRGQGTVGVVRPPAVVLPAAHLGRKRPRQRLNH